MNTLLTGSRGVLEDLIFAMRALSKDRLFSTAAAFTLALAIGANTAIFTLVNAVWLRPIPVQSPERLAVWYTRTSSRPDASLADRFSWEAFKAVQSGTETLTAVGAEGSPSLNDVCVNLPGRDCLVAKAVSANYFTVLGVPVRGSGFAKADELPGAPPVVVISHTLWTSEFRSDSAVIGQTVMLSGRRTTILGIAPEGFRGPRLGDATDVWIPLNAAAWFTPSIPPHVFLRMASSLLPLRLYGRLRDDVPMSQAQAEARTLRLPKASGGVVLKTLAETAYPAAMQGREGQDQQLALLLGATALVVFLVGCLNLATLFLSRAEQRAGEIAVRIALGIPRARLVRLLGAEALLLSAVGGVIALGVSEALLQTLRTFSLPTGIALSTLHLTPDWRVAAFTGLVSLLAMAACGIGPTARAFGPALIGTLAAVGATPSRTSLRWRSSLLVGHVTLSLLLIIGAALFVTSVRKALSKDLGFSNERTAFVLVRPNLARYATASFEDVDIRRWSADCRVVQDQLRELQGVVAVAEGRSPLMSSGPGGSRPQISVTTESGSVKLVVVSVAVGPGYFTSLGIALAAGRGFSEADAAARFQRPVIVSQSLANQLWPGENPLGRRFCIAEAGGRERKSDPALAGGDPSDRADQMDFMFVIGVTRTSARDGVRGAELPTFYELDSRDEATRMMSGPHAFAVRTKASAGQLRPAIAAVVRRVFPDASLLRVSTAQEEIAAEITRERMGARLFSWFGLVALCLNVAGVWGLVAYCIASRTREMAVRLALGAPRVVLIRAMLWRGVRPVVIGCALGLACAAAMQRLIASFLFEVAPLRPVLFALCALLFLLVSSTAALLPARRLRQLDPVAALRPE